MLLAATDIYLSLKENTVGMTKTSFPCSSLLPGLPTVISQHLITPRKIKYFEGL